MTPVAGEFRRAGAAIGREYHAVLLAIQRDRRHDNRRLRRQSSLYFGISRIALGKAEAMPAAVDDHVDKVRVVMGYRRPFETGVVELPVRRPLPPQWFGDVAPVG